MNIKTFTTQKVATKLRNPKVRFNSFVNHAATKIPFARIKQEETILSHNGDDAMENPVLQKITFEKTFFTREKADEILKEIGFEDYTFSETDTHLTVVNDSADQEKESKDIPGKVSGLTFSVYKEEISEEPKDEPKEEEKSASEIEKTEKDELPRFRELEDSTPVSEPAPEEIENAAKKPEKKPVKGSKDKPEKDKDKKPKKKYDGWAAYCSGETSMSGVMGDADDGTPIGFYELTNAMTIAVSNNLKASDYSGVQAVCAQFADALISIDKTYRGIVSPAAEVTNSATEEPKPADETVEPEEEKKAETPVDPLESLKAEIVAMRAEMAELRGKSAVTAIGSKSIQEDVSQKSDTVDTYKAERLKREAEELEKDRKFAEKLHKNIIGIK